MQVNEQIRDSEVRVIGDGGEQLGVMSSRDAQRLADEKNLDLVKIAPTATPPVCRIMDFGKLCYEQKKKMKDQKRHNQAQKVKEIKFRLNIDTHDYEFKIAHGIEFLEEGNKLKVTIMFKGREMAHPEKGFELIDKITESLKDKGVLDAPGKLLGRNICVSYSPVK